MHKRAIFLRSEVITPLQRRNSIKQFKATPERGVWYISIVNGSTMTTVRRSLIGIPASALSQYFCCNAFRFFVSRYDDMHRLGGTDRFSTPAKLVLTSD